MNKLQESLRENRSAAFMSVMKLESPDKFEYVSKVGIPGYENECENLKNRLAEIYYELEGRNKMNYFYLDELQDLFATKQSFYTNMNKFPFTNSYNLLPLNTLRKWQEVIRRYDEWKENKRRNK